jgi:hypothetical protein
MTPATYFAPGTRLSPARIPFAVAFPIERAATFFNDLQARAEDGDFDDGDSLRAIATLFIADQLANMTAARVARGQIITRATYLARRCARLDDAIAATLRRRAC